jgi:peroxiredoxin
MPLSVNQTVPDFTLPDTDGNKVALDVASAPATVVVFTTNHCPYARAWHQRINDVARDYTGRGVRFLQVNPNDAVRYPSDSLEEMRKRVDAGEFASPYLYDESQDVARAWGAQTTPDVFVMDSSGRLRYRGAPDADYSDESMRANWLREALDDVLTGKELARPETRPVGCSIKWRA